MEIKGNFTAIKYIRQYSIPEIVDFKEESGRIVISQLEEIKRTIKDALDRTSIERL